MEALFWLFVSLAASDVLVNAQNGCGTAPPQYRATVGHTTTGFSSKTGYTYTSNYVCCDNKAVLSGSATTTCTLSNAGVASGWSPVSFSCASPAGATCPILPETAPFSTPILPAGSPAAQIFPVSQPEVVNMHNCIRNNVNNPAPCPGSIPQLQWDNDLAYLAEQYVSTCPGLTHGMYSGLSNRSTNGYTWMPTIGQNICVSSCQESWSQCILAWAAEVANFVYGSGASPSTAMVGHYTQVVASSSVSVGCAWAYCPNSGSSALQYQYVCNYGPAGNCNGCSNEPNKNGVIYPYPSSGVGCKFHKETATTFRRETKPCSVDILK